MKRYKRLFESRISNIKDLENLKNSDVITMYHGSTIGVVNSIIEDGIDGTKKIARRTGDNIGNGFFVTFNMDTAKNFSSGYILEIEVPGNALVSAYPLREPNADFTFIDEKFPKSENPLLSFSLSTGEQEALITKKLSSKHVKAVHYLNPKYKKYIRIPIKQWIDRGIKNEKI